jgi:hypothetical protein
MRDPWIVYLALSSLVAVVCGVLAYAWTRGRLGVVSAGVFAVALAAWVADFAAITTGYRDADGFVDCTRCTATHYVATLGFIAPPLLIAIAAAGMAIALIARGRRRRRSA